MNKYIDKWGLLDKLRAPDGGDSCQREGMYWSLLGMLSLKKRIDWLYESKRLAGESGNIFQKLHPHPGVLLRHSNPDYDSSDWDRMSRDQLQSMVIAMGYWDQQQLKQLTWGHLKRGFIFTNNTRQNGATKRNHGANGYSYAWKFPDITGPEIWGNFIRAFNAWWLYPLLVIFDIELFGGAIRWRFFSKHNIALNHTLSQMQAIDRMPTPLSWLASKIMPVPKLIEICKDHLDDPYVEMPEFGSMFDDAWASICTKR